MRRKPIGSPLTRGGGAEEANRLAGKANEISADANAISQRALSVTADQTVYKWRVTFDGESSTVFLLNDCPHEASDVHVFVHHEDQTIMDRIVDEAPAFGEIPLKDELFTQKIVEDQRSSTDSTPVPGSSTSGSAGMTSPSMSPIPRTSGADAAMRSSIA
ncbi:hypothetical protein BFS25_05835 [Bifidobacterium longum subsp. infantis]|nr:hypothetical protein BFS25_05835 [Bifidobacterium longum subsp. infantis]